MSAPAFTRIEFDTWVRTPLFRHFCAFDIPCYSITFEWTVLPLYQWAKAHNESFFLLTLYALLRAANSVPELRQRFTWPNPECIIEYDVLKVLTPIMTPQNLYNDTLLDYAPDFESFKAAARPRIQEAARALHDPIPIEYDDFICLSCAPFADFTALAHGVCRSHQSTPVLSWSKMSERGTITAGCQFNHALLDGLHAGRFSDAVRAGFTHPETLYFKNR